jgi:TonB-linked SusC/RagA family outer membrane protein
MRALRPILYAFLLLLLCAPLHLAQAQDTGTIRGTVVDEEEAPLPGVNVTIVGTTQGSSTDVEGNYQITGLAPDTYTLRASFVGYTTREREVTVTAGETTTVDFTLEPDVAALDEVVVVGYGQQERRDLTGAISSVDGSDINRVATSSVEQALQGQVAGLQVKPTSGEPGAGAQIRVRGVGTFNDASPLYVVDGVLTDDISYLNPNDIESINVLKDASATAIYGSRGANGVIIVETRQGQRNQGTTFSARVSRGWQQIMDPIELTNARQYAVLANELRANTGGQPAFDNPDQFGEGTDWQDVVYRTAPVQDVQLSARGGTDVITYNFSANYLREEGILRKSDFQRASLRANNTYQLTDALELGHNLTFTYRTGVEAPGVVGSAYRADPTVPPRNEDGEFANASARASAGNPAASIFYHRNEYNGTRFVGNLYAEASFLDNFTFKSSFGLDLDQRETRDLTPEFFVSPPQQNQQSRLSISTTEENSWIWENTLTYDRTVGDHDINVLGGVTAQEFRNEVFGGARVNIIGEDESLWYLDAGQQDGQTNFNSAFDWSMLSGLARVNYAYLGRYLVTATMRVDGSSRFGENNRYGYFPSAALGWRVSDEAFMEDVDLISNLKLRASWGIIGNDKITAYPGIPVVSSNLNAVFGETESLQFGATLAELANPDIRWEETTQSDVGLNIGLFENQLTAEVDYYRRTTSGILLRVPIPRYVGVNTEPFVNAAEVRNTGVDLTLNWTQSLSDEVSYQIGVTGSTTNNEVLELGQGNEELLGGGLVNEIPFTTRSVPGTPIGAFYGYKVDGIYQTQEDINNSPSQPGVVPGDLSFMDLACDDGDVAPGDAGPDTPAGAICENGLDGEVTGADRTQIGSPIPDFVFGVNLSLDIYNFDVSAALSGQTGFQIFNAKKSVRFGIENFETSYLDRWNGPGTSSTEPRLTNAGHNYQSSEYLLEDGDFLKLRNVQIGYTLPDAWTSAANVNSLRVFANGTNLVTFTGYSGYTPEISGGSVISDAIDDGIYPIARTFTIGVDMTF